MSKLKGIVALTRPYVLLTTLSFFIAAAFLSVTTVPPLMPFFIGLSATGLAIAAAHTLNDYADREVDKQNPRTAQRPIPMALVSPRQALVIGLSFGVCAVLLTLFMNPLCMLLAFCGVPLPFLYNYLRKRRIPISFICTVLAVILIILFGSASVSGQLFPNFVWVFVIFGIAWETGRTLTSEVQDVDLDTISNIMTLSTKISSKRAADLIFVFFTFAVAVSLVIGFEPYLGIIYLIPSLAAAIWLLYRTLELVKAPTTPNAIRMRVRAPRYLVTVSFLIVVTIWVNRLLLGL